MLVSPSNTHSVLAPEEQKEHCHEGADEQGDGDEVDDEIEPVTTDTYKPKNRSFRQNAIVKGFTSVDENAFIYVSNTQ